MAWQMMASPRLAHALDIFCIGCAPLTAAGGSYKARTFIFSFSAKIDQCAMASTILLFGPCNILEFSLVE